MCDSVTMGHIQDVVEKFVEDQRMFTAYDVTCEVREIVGKGVNIRHKEIKNDVHKEMAQHLDGDWNKSLQDVGAPVKAFVYHPFMSDPETYEPRKQTTVDGQATPQTSTASVPSDDSTVATVSSSDAFAVDGRSRLLIPTNFMQYLGVKAGDDVKIYKELDFLVISVKDQQLRELASLKVDNHGYLYLSPKVLNQGDFGDVQSFGVETANDTVEVTKA